ncbi:hypothetical protein M2302_000304 [Micromonospora sp. A200]|uniref:hypothetical protein n=1 Tax=Micromonospora sp. A200 TaxID=2940568 RepID=UPI002473E4A5|nr:hypothetical protein [Micromonospora sp. A200]MDH6460153.1 hypothetical protein [Micromonospora sp. A200]
MELLIAVLILIVTHALAFRAGGWYLRWRGLRHQMRAAQIACTGQHREDVLADFRRQIRAILPRFHMPRFHARSH